eukprot:Lithocolla_globosa_v1_NODE_1252_length_2731_cov_28.184604.p2 type:complete len:334 gc:universal NODE_1252_length_2731_cov_28.184604:1174-173(-)
MKERTIQRKEQSRQDRQKYLASLTAWPLGEYRDFLQDLRENGIESGSKNAVPDDLVGFSATLIELLQPSSSSSSFLSSTNTEQGHGQPHQKEDLLLFIQRLLRSSRLSCSTFILSCFYLLRCSTSDSVLLQYFDPHSLFLVAIMVADKYLNDECFANIYWSKQSHLYDLEQLNKMEMNFLEILDFRLFFSEEIFEDFLSFLELYLTQQQMRFHPHLLTYRDLLLLNTPVSNNPFVKLLPSFQSPRDSTFLLFRSVASYAVIYTIFMISVYGAYQSVVLNEQQLEAFEACHIPYENLYLNQLPFAYNSCSNQVHRAMASRTQIFQPELGHELKT